jgi:16S rRNA processing protein RimM
MIGEMVGVHGIHGEARLRPFNADSEVLADVSQVFLVSPSGAPRVARLEGARPHGAVWLVRLERISTPEAAQALRGNRVAVRERDLPALDGGQFYCYRLIGLQVVGESGEGIGIVEDVLATPGNDVLVVRDGSKERMIPMVDRLIGEIDLDRGTIVVRAIEGLLD